MMKPEQPQHCWEPLKEHEISDGEEPLDFVERGLEGKANILKNLKINEFFVVNEMPAKKTDTSNFNNYIKYFKQEGLDLGKGDSQYGYKMLLAKPHEERRKLIVFRRH